MAHNENNFSGDPEEEFVFDHELYAHVAQRAQLKWLFLLQSDYVAKPDLFDDEVDRFKRPYGSHGEMVFNKIDGRLSGYYTWGIRFKKRNKVVLKLVCKFILSYRNLHECDEGHVRVYFEKIAKFTTYPYFRGIFASQTSNSGLILPPLPALSERVD